MLYDPKWTPPDIILEEWQTVLLDAANYIEKHGWIQGGMEHPDGRVCAFGALTHAAKFTSGDYWVHDGYRLAVHHLVDKVGHIPMWNDHPWQTKEEVVSTLRKVARNVV